MARTVFAAACSFLILADCFVKDPMEALRLGGATIQSSLYRILFALVKGFQRLLNAVIFLRLFLVCRPERSAWKIDGRIIDDGRGVEGSRGFRVVKMPQRGVLPKSSPKPEGGAVAI
jgi:hypothetical protein